MLDTRLQCWQTNYIRYMLFCVTVLQCVASCVYSDPCTCSIACMHFSTAQHVKNATCCRTAAQAAKGDTDCSRPHKSSCADGAVLERRHEQCALGSHGHVQSACHWRYAACIHVHLYLVVQNARAVLYECQQVSSASSCASCRCITHRLTPCTDSHAHAFLCSRSECAGGCMTQTVAVSRTDRQAGQHVLVVHMTVGSYRLSQGLVHTNCV